MILALFPGGLVIDYSKRGEEFVRHYATMLPRVIFMLIEN